LLLRLCLFTPLHLLALAALPRLSPAVREWSGPLMSAATGYVHLHLSLVSQDELALPYLMCLTLPLLYNSGVAKTPFWMVLRIHFLILVMFAYALGAIPHHHVPLMITMALAMAGTSLFTLYGIYWREHEERSNWLMQRHEQVLLDELGKRNDDLERLSRHGSLTDLPNRRQADAFLQQVWARAQQSGDEVAVLMMDVDHFKRYNDHHGHQAGDTCLQTVAALLRQFVRGPHDLVARFGGEEFIAILPHADMATAHAVAERIRIGIAERRIPHGGAPDVPCVTMSIGVASVHPATARSASPAALIAAADAALYEAKTSGRNR